MITIFCDNDFINFVEGYIISAKVVGYHHGILAKLYITKYSASFGKYFVIFSLHSKKSEVEIQ